ncbi:lipinlike protein putative [Babesia caballi]|uniref:Lipinlike protein putative n=1 Tax=Babesia caballi TaxID=5871 RepID=A0AAV4M473_BABCB|nr:lipinlike protein putative [Babesia caballi]
MMFWFLAVAYFATLARCTAEQAAAPAAAASPAAAATASPAPATTATPTPATQAAETENTLVVSTTDTKSGQKPLDIIRSTLNGEEDVYIGRIQGTIDEVSSHTDDVLKEYANEKLTRHKQKHVVDCEELKKLIKEKLDKNEITIADTRGHENSTQRGFWLFKERKTPQFFGKLFELMDKTQYDADKRYLTVIATTCPVASILGSSTDVETSVGEPQNPASINGNGPGTSAGGDENLKKAKSSIFEPSAVVGILAIVMATVLA